MSRKSENAIKPVA